jgi:four helix bundle protein
MRDHTKLRAFELADHLAVIIYMITKKFPKEEIFGLTSQIRRAVVSVPSNIVEGCARESQLEYRRFLEIAYSSLKEVDYQFSLAVKLTYLQTTDPQVIECLNKLEESKKVLGSLLHSIR